MSKENMGELKARDVMKGLSKLMISHPNIITGTHDQIQNMLKGKTKSTNITLVYKRKKQRNKCESLKVTLLSDHV